MAIDSFSGKQIPKGTGVLFVTKRGKALAFGSSKTEKNALNLKRKPRKVKWTQLYHTEKAILIKGGVKASHEEAATLISEEDLNEETPGKETPSKQPQPKETKSAAAPKKAKQKESAK
ncbi:50S ribosomal protein L24e [uncultured archaeon]|nr:50S ribosomal protein L24e [uncultured archaeon]